MKITKHEWDQFWQVLGSDWYFDESDLPEDLEDESADAVLTLTYGILCYQGDRGKEAKVIPGIFTKAQVQAAIDDGFRGGHDLCAALRRWRKSRTVEVVRIEIAKDKRADLERYCAELGAKVMR